MATPYIRGVRKRMVTESLWNAQWHCRMLLYAYFSIEWTKGSEMVLYSSVIWSIRQSNIIFTEVVFFLIRFFRQREKKIINSYYSNECMTFNGWWWWCRQHRLTANAEKCKIRSLCLRQKKIHTRTHGRKHHIFHLRRPDTERCDFNVNSNNIHAYLILTNIPKDSTNIWNMMPSKRNFVSRPLSACNSFDSQPNAVVVIVIIIFIRAKTKLMPITSQPPSKPDSHEEIR